MKRISCKFGNLSLKMCGMIRSRNKDTCPTCVIWKLPDEVLINTSITYASLYKKPVSKIGK